MNFDQIVDEINEVVASSGRPYTSWVIGVTDDPARRKKEHQRDRRDPLQWYQWNAENEDVARGVEMYFIVSKEMQGGFGGSGSADYVYIF